MILNSPKISIINVIWLEARGQKAVWTLIITTNKKKKKKEKRKEWVDK